jgi:hypothetical protein
VAKLVLGFSNAVWSGMAPKTPKDANKKTSGMKDAINKNKVQNQSLGFEKFDLDFLFFAIFMIIERFRC